MNQPRLEVRSGIEPERLVRYLSRGAILPEDVPEETLCEIPGELMARPEMKRTLLHVSKVRPSYFVDESSKPALIRLSEIRPRRLRYWMEKNDHEPNIFVYLGGLYLTKYCGEALLSAYGRWCALQAVLYAGYRQEVVLRWLRYGRMEDKAAARDTSRAASIDTSLNSTEFNLPNLVSAYRSMFAAWYSTHTWHDAVSFSGRAFHGPGGEAYHHHRRLQILHMFRQGLAGQTEWKWEETTNG